MAMLQLIYASAATIKFSTVDLQELLKRARENNQSLGVSGMLVFHEDSFLQILEGDEEVVQALYHKIESDDRHANIKLLLRAKIDERSFGDWRMGFYDTSQNRGLADTGFVDFFRKGSEFDETIADRARRTLMRFRDGAWRQHVTG